jgi:16S rRNA (cytosine1402-N4)-methyltransferase
MSSEVPRGVAGTSDGAAPSATGGGADEYHVPVMLRETLDWLVTDQAGIYVDGTLGGGGHTSAILEAIAPAGGVVIGVDRDEEALAQTCGRLRAHVDAGRLHPLHTSFRYLPEALARLQLPALAAHGGLSGLLLDLGVSSHQIDADYRGFSFRHDSPLDMRMDAGSSMPTAKDFLNTCDASELVRVLQDYGEEKYARPIARAILGARPHETTLGLVAAIESVTPEPKRIKTFARVFQALRILVNDELGELESVLLAAARLIRPGGRLAILSYHSLEDRRAKNVMRSGHLDGRIDKDEMGNALSHWRPLTRKPVLAAGTEIQRNGRARSAKLRVAERTEFDATPWR